MNKWTYALILVYNQCVLFYFSYLFIYFLYFSLNSNDWNAQPLRSASASLDFPQRTARDVITSRPNVDFISRRNGQQPSVSLD